MKIRVIHIVSSLEAINMGVWNVVSNTIPLLEKNGLLLEIWSRNIKEIPDDLKRYHVVNFTSIDEATDKILNSNPLETIVITHGNWSYPTRIGLKLKKMGYSWLSYPHGMLEPWSMNYKALKKKAYFNLVEKPALNKSDALVAVGRPEFENLVRLLPGHRIEHIPNGIQTVSKVIEKREKPLNFVFLARLHEKKRPLEFVKAWVNSKISTQKDAQLTMAGPDEGEFDKINKYILDNHVHNVVLSPPLYGKFKIDLLKSAHFFVLPSLSEGFPTTIIEAMTHGCIPLITSGCNFPEAIEAGVAIDLTYNPQHSIKCIEEILEWEVSKLESMSENAKLFADKNYSIELIAERQMKLFENIIIKTGK